MPEFPDKHEQIRQMHALLIVGVVQASQQGETPPSLEQALQVSEKNGWGALITAIRKIIAGDRSETLLTPLDEEDQVILSSILLGIQNPNTLPDPAAEADASQAAPGLAGMIHASRTGDAQALHVLGGMAEQMLAAGGDMARLSAVMKRLVDGERDPDILSKGMGAQGESLLISILDNLAKLEAH